MKRKSVKVELDGRIFLNAAELIDRNRSNAACGAINNSVRDWDETDKYKKELAKYFKPKNLTMHQRWFGDGMGVDQDHLLDNPYRKHRVMALLFLAEIHGGIDHG
jgi:hypothetical protein